MPLRALIYAFLETPAIQHIFRLDGLIQRGRSCLSCCGVPVGLAMLRRIRSMERAERVLPLPSNW